MRWKLAFALLAVSSGALYAQDPPIKMGLWEKTMSMTGMPLGLGNMKGKSCITPETWQQIFANANKQPQSCKIDLKRSETGYTYETTCTVHGGTMHTTGGATIVDPEHIKAESHTTADFGGKTRQIDSQSESHWVGADCGKVKPGEPKVE